MRRNTRSSSAAAEHQVDEPAAKRVRPRLPTVVQELGVVAPHVFQGVGQTAMDLVLLGAVPTVALAFAAAVILDAIVEMVSTRSLPND